MNVAAVPPAPADTMRAGGDPSDAPAPGFDLLLAGATRPKRAPGSADPRADGQPAPDDTAEPVAPAPKQQAESAPTEPEAPAETVAGPPADPALMLAALAIILPSDLPADAAAETTAEPAVAEQPAAVVELVVSQPVADSSTPGPANPVVPIDPVAAGADEPTPPDPSHPAADEGTAPPVVANAASAPAAATTGRPVDRRAAGPDSSQPTAGAPRADLPEQASDRAHEVVAALDQQHAVPTGRPAAVPAAPTVPPPGPAARASEQAHDVVAGVNDVRPPVPAAPPAAAVAPAEPRDLRPPVPPPVPADQLVAVLRPLRLAPDGAYRLGLELRPPELGRVEVRVEMRDGVLHATMRAEHEHAQHALRDAMAHLRARLETDGIRAGRLTVDDGRGGANGSAGDRGAARRDGDPLRHSRPQPLPRVDPVVDLLRADDGLDVRL